MILHIILGQSFSSKPSESKSSKKETLEHLTDSATNDHQQFVGVQFEESPTIIYDRIDWHHYSFYNEAASSQRIAFWKQYNLHLQLIQRIPGLDLQRNCCLGAENATIEFVFIDHLAHLEHHFHQILNYN
jgi:hypothetical protein